MSAHRYAIYVVPEGPWRHLGTRWLGRDALTGETLTRPGLLEPASASPRFAASDIDAWTDAPRHYGLHATLKPPFRLMAGATPDDLDHALRQLAARSTAFEIPLSLHALRGFLAWRLTESGGPGATGTEDIAAGKLTALADACVADLDAFRALPSEAELSKRRAAGLTAAQEANLVRWGYPYVFDTFIFHITLTKRLDEATMAHARDMLARIARQDAQWQPALQDGARMHIGEIGLFVQASADAPFLLARGYRFDGTTYDAAGIVSSGLPVDIEGDAFDALTRSGRESIS